MNSVTKTNILGHILSHRLEIAVNKNFFLIRVNYGVNKCCRFSASCKLQEVSGLDCKKKSIEKLQSVYLECKLTIIIQHSSMTI